MGRRKEKYKKVIVQGDITDERFFKEAERILYDEVQYVLNIRREELLPLIFSMIEE